MSGGVPRLGLIGLGDIGVTAHLPALLRSDRLDLAVVADLSPQRRADAEPLLDGHRIEVVEDADEVWARDLDAVVLATPPWVTPGLAEAALARGLHVLAEKPVAVSIAEAEHLRALPPEWLDRYQLGLTYRHDRAIERLHTVIDEKLLGPGPLLVHASIYDEARDTADPEHAERILGALQHGHPALHEGAHVFDWLAATLGPPDAVEDAWSLTTLAEAPAPNVVGARLRYPGGTIANVEFGWLLDVLPPAFIRFTGSHGIAELDVVTFDLTVTTSAGTELFHQDEPKTARCFDRQLESFLDLVTGVVSTPSVGVADGVSTLRIAERISEILAQTPPTGNGRTA